MADPYEVEERVSDKEFEKIKDLLDSGPSAVLARTRITRGSRPDSWNRKTRFLAGVDRLPQRPGQASAHVAYVWPMLLARVIKYGWDYVKGHPKQPHDWYVSVVRIYAGEYAHDHALRCPRCKAEEWQWLFDVTDTT